MWRNRLRCQRTVVIPTTSTERAKWTQRLNFKEQTATLYNVKTWDIFLSAGHAWPVFFILFVGFVLHFHAMVGKAGLQLRFDFDSTAVWYAIVLLVDSATTIQQPNVTNGLLHWRGQCDWLAGYVIVTSITFDKQSTSRRTAVESKANRSCNRRIVWTTWPG